MKYLSRVVAIGLVPIAVWGAVESQRLTLQQVNAKVATVLQPLQNQLTRARLLFRYIQVNATEQRVSVGGLYSKRGENNTIRVNLNSARFEMGEKKSFGSLDLNADFNFVTAFGQEYVNEMGGFASEQVAQFIRRYAESQNYGEAATVDAAVDAIEYDGNKNITLSAFHLKLQIDLSKLPASKPANSVELTKLEARVRLTPTSARIILSADLNPQYAWFGERRKDLTQILERFLNGDDNLYGNIGEAFLYLDRAAKDLVDMKASPRRQ